MKSAIVALFVCLVGAEYFPYVDTLIKVIVPLLCGILSKIIELHYRAHEEKQKRDHELKIKRLQKFDSLNDSIDLKNGKDLDK